MKVTEFELDGVLRIEPDVFGDPRGYFMETFHRDSYADIGLTKSFVQSNLSKSTFGVLRGLHFQVGQPQGKLVGAVTGTIFDVAADIDPASSTYGKWVGVELSEDNHHQLYIPPGYAHGFVVLSETAHINYMCTDLYAGPDDDFGVLWNDPDLAIDWPVDQPTLSNKDLARPSLREYIAEST